MITPSARPTLKHSAMAQRRAAATAKGGAAEEGFPMQTMDAWIVPAGSDGARLRVD
ncbi:hypothetical protein [Burkholderia plantarii]|uniref:hypothetical protein n=1 Tax=Burkholderia plantarii TaxID=41899 RepID=UPI000A535788|nr:hypothetical protein [Burkholderia plantarii]